MQVRKPAATALDVLTIIFQMGRINDGTGKNSEPAPDNSGN